MPETITSQLAPKSDNRIILQMDASLYFQNLSACMQAFENAEDVDLDTGGDAFKISQKRCEKNDS